MIARMVGRLTGRSIGYVQLARGQFDNVMQQSQARQVQKELQDVLSQLDSVRYEVCNLSLMPVPMTRKLMENPDGLAPPPNARGQQFHRESQGGTKVANKADKENVQGSHIVLEAVLEAEVARNAKDFFSQPENQIQ